MLLLWVWSLIWQVGSFEQMCIAIQNTLSDTTGMYCDGVKSTCT
ncbi:L-serine ammonia-lyase, iron-sulfur-dependent, subunit alpha [Photobacterium leiognathi]